MSETSKYGWNQNRYEGQKAAFQDQLNRKVVTPYDLMQKYKRCVETEDYEACKALTEVLEPLNYFTADTHRHIPCLNEPKRP